MMHAKRMNRRFQWPLSIIVALVLLLALVGCLPLATPTLTPKSVVVQLTTTATSSQQSPTPTEQPTTPTPISSVTPTQELTTPTAQPTLSADDAKSTVFDLVQNNGRCLLPCLWGVAPGGIKTQALESLLAKFGNAMSPNEDTVLRVNRFDNSGGIHLSVYEGDLDFRISFSYYADGGTVDILVLRAMVTNKSDKVAVFGNPRFNELLQHSMPPRVLSDYGQPSQVIIAPFLDDPDYPAPKWTPFSLVLFYPEKGILAEYIMPRETKGDRFLGCPQKSYLQLAVWDPQRPRALNEIVPRISERGINELNVDYFKSIEDATSLSLSEFFSMFKDPQNSACLATPISIWPKP